MKLVYAIVNSDDTYAVNKGLLKAGIRATKLSSTGGFLMSGNTTFLICCPDEQVDLVIEVCKKYSKKSSNYNIAKKKSTDNILFCCLYNFYVGIFSEIEIRIFIRK